MGKRIIFKPTRVVNWQNSARMYIYIYETKQNYSFVHCDTVEISNSKLCTHTHCEAFSEHAYYKLFNTD